MNQYQVGGPQLGFMGEPQYNIPNDPRQGMLIIKAGVQNTEFYRKKLNCQILRALSISQVVLWAVVTISQIVAIAVQARINQIGTGLWTGIFFGIAGGLGIVAASKPTRCMIVSLMVMSIFAAIFAGFLLGLSATGIAVSVDCHFYCGPSPAAGAVFYGLMVFSALAEGIISIITAALCCRASCCRTSMEPIAKFVPAGQEAQSALGASGYMMTIPVNVTGSAPFQGFAPTTGYMAGVPSVQAPATVSSMPHASAGFNVVSFPETGVPETSDDKNLLL